jgi:hypothetical protein
MIMMRERERENSSMCQIQSLLIPLGPFTLQIPLNEKDEVSFIYSFYIVTRNTGIKLAEGFGWKCYLRKLNIALWIWICFKIGIV